MITTAILCIVCLFGGFFCGLFTEAHARDKALYYTRHEQDYTMEMMTQANSELLRKLREGGIDV